MTKQLIVVFLAFASVTAQAQDVRRRSSNRSTRMTRPPPKPSTPKYNARLNVLSLISGTLGGIFDIKINEKATVGPMVGAYYRSYGSFSMLGYTLGAAANFFPLNPALTSGAYIQPFFSYSGVSYSTTYSTTSSAFGIISLGATGGYQYFFPNGFNLGGGAGLAYYKVTGLNDLGGPTGLGGVGLTLDGTIGYAF